VPAAGAQLVEAHLGAGPQVELAVVEQPDARHLPVAGGAGDAHGVALGERLLVARALEDRAVGGAPGDRLDRTAHEQRGALALGRGLVNVANGQGGPGQQRGEQQEEAEQGQPGEAQGALGRGDGRRWFDLLHRYRGAARATGSRWPSPPAGARPR
jgi:hypothetical protein